MYKTNDDVRILSQISEAPPPYRVLVKNACQVDLDQVLDAVLAQLPTSYVEGALICTEVHTENVAAESSSAKHQAAEATITKAGILQEKHDTPIDGE